MIHNAATKPRDISRNGRGLHEPIPISQQGSSVLSRIKHILPHREDIVMQDGRQIKGGIVLHPIVATALLGVIVTAATVMYRTFSAELAWQHDQIIVITTQKADAADALKAEKAERATEKIMRESTDEAWRTNMKVELAQIKDQLKTKRGNN